MQETAGRMQALTLFLAGDVMTGRGIDQVLPHPSEPRLYEPYVRDARGYVELAEQLNGPIPRPVEYTYVWGDALGELERAAPDARIVNLETSVTVSDSPWFGKGVHYRMHPANVPCLTAAKLDCCVLANNHVLDWGYEGLAETLATLHGAALATAGAGANASQAAAPSIIDVPGERRILVFAFGAESSGIPPAWRAEADKPGVNLVPLSAAAAARAAAFIQSFRQPGDVVVASIHWGGNWGYTIPREQHDFAHALIDSGAVDVVHGHSSHHAKGIEVHRGRPILYGCGDFLDDYEGITGYERYRSDLSLMYLVAVDASSGGLVGLEITPFRVERFRLHRATKADAAWLKDMFDSRGAELGTRAELGADGRLVLRWM